MIKVETITSKYDGLSLELEMIIPDKDIRGIVQISHGMAEYKKRYRDFMKYLSDYGYVTIINDHRGHGSSVSKKEDLGFFYTEDINAIVNDLHQITIYIKEKFPNVPLYLFSHSMGTLVARNYIKKYDYEIDKLILCGPPTKNSAVDLGIILSKISKKLRGEKYRNKTIDKIVFGSFNKGYIKENSWICSDEKLVDKYSDDEFCGFKFTNNGFINLFKLLKEAFSKDGWGVKNPNLPIFMIAGKDDPVIQGEKKFNHLGEFLKEVGYKNVTQKLYEGQRHELLNETKNLETYKDILKFLDSKN